jgi:hypothetical protein
MCIARYSKMCESKYFLDIAEHGSEVLNVKWEVSI